MSNYTPDEAYVRASLIAQIDWERRSTGDFRPGDGKKVVEEADRLLAKVKADALRSAAEATRREASGEPHAGALFSSHADWLTERADRIEEAGR